MKFSRIIPFLFPALFLVLAVSSPLQAQSPPARERPALISVDETPTPGLMQTLRALDMDIAYVGRSGEGIHIVADLVDMLRLRNKGISFTVVYDDVIAFYQSRFTFDPSLSRDLGYGSMGGFFTYSEVEAKLDEFRTNYPTLITARSSIGKSRQNRDLWAVKISDNPDIDEPEPEAIIDSLTHAREPQGMMSTLYFMDWVLENYPTDPMAKFLVEEREMWIVPVQNPDGYVYNEQTNPNGGGMWRKNRRYNNFYSRGVDLNRNWSYKWGYDNMGSSGSPSSETYRGPSAMSEPEDQAMGSFISSRGAVERLSIHCYGNMWIIPWCYDYILTPDDALFRAVADEMAPDGYDIGTSWELLYLVNGGSVDWDYGDQGILTFSPEMGRVTDGFWPSTDRIVPIAQKNLPSLQYFFAISGSFLEWEDTAFSEVVGNGNGHPEPGETIDVVVDITNKGLADCGTPVTLNISTTSPDVNILTGSVQLSAIPSRTTVDNAAQPFVLEILPGAGHGDVFDIVLELLFDGARLEGKESFIVGVPRVVVFDDMEADEGWQAGAPGDTATAGIWERADPNGTWLSGKPMQPEDDHTAAGTDCFVTGNSPPGADPGDNDVDDGKTTLVSPLFDLTGGIMPRIGYSRWWANAFGRGGIDDEFLVEISNDGGSTWMEFEKTAGGQYNFWEEVLINVEDVITPTDSMRVRFVAEDAGAIYPNQSIVEAAIDDFRAECFTAQPVLTVLGDFVVNSDFTIRISWDGGASYKVYASPNLGPGTPYQGGIWYLDPPLTLLNSGTIPSEETTVVTLTIPNNPGLVGKTFYFQSYAVPNGGGTPMISNVTSRTVAP